MIKPVLEHLFWNIIVVHLLKTSTVTVVTYICRVY